MFVGQWYIAVNLLLISGEISGEIFVQVNQKMIQSHSVAHQVSTIHCGVYCVQTSACSVFLYNNTICLLGRETSKLDEKLVPMRGEVVWVMTSPKRIEKFKEPAGLQLLVSLPSNSSDLRLLNCNNFTSTEIPDTAGSIASIVWDSVENKILASYWPPKLVSFAVDGSHKSKLSEVYATDMELDEGRRILFYVDSRNRTLSSMKTDGSDVTIILKDMGIFAIGLDVENRIIYYIKEAYYNEYIQDNVMTASYDGSRQINRGGHSQRTSAFFLNREEKRWYIASLLAIDAKPVKYKDDETIFEHTTVVEDNGDGKTIDDIVAYRDKLIFLKRINNNGQEEARFEKYYTNGKRITEQPIDVPDGAGTRRFLLEMIF